MLSCKNTTKLGFLLRFSLFVYEKNGILLLAVLNCLPFEKLTGVAFEPTHPKILRPERSALDHSAILPED